MYLCASISLTTNNVCFLNIINPLVFIMDKGYTVCEVGAEFIHIIHIIVSRQSVTNKEGTLNRKLI